MKITKVEAGKSLAVTNVEMRECLVEDLIQAERMSGKNQGVEYLAAVLSQVGTFDGAALPPEDIKRLSAKDFLACTAELGLADTATSQDM